MSTTAQLIQELAGCYFAGPQGAIGRYQADGGFVADQQSGPQLASVIAELSRALERDPCRDNMFIGLVYPADKTKPWRSPTLNFTDHIVETLYPVHGVRTGVLTTFQKRNREHSVFQGLELLLSYRRETFPERPVFCPVLVNRDQCLAEYAQVLPDRNPGSDDKTTPVLEILNLFALTPFDDPNYAAISELCMRIAQNTIKNKQRKDLAFSIDAPAVSTPAQQSVSDTTVGNSFISGQTTEGAARPHTRSSNMEFVAESGGNTDYQAPAPQPANPFISSNQVHPDHLRRFGMFATLDVAQLDQLAGQLLLETASPGTHLIVRGAVDPWFYFLLEGIVALRADDGNSRRIEAGSEPARQPLSRLLPRKYDVTAMTPITFIRSHQKVLEKVFKL